MLRCLLIYIREIVVFIKKRVFPPLTLVTPNYHDILHVINLYVFRTSELVALMAISTTLFLFLHTRDLHTKLKEMEVKLTNPEDLTSNQISGKIQ